MNSAVKIADKPAKRSSKAAPLPTATHLPIAIIGAGFGGICLAIKLREAGIHDFTIIERANGLGGTWKLNNYPGCACDVPSTLYSYSFAPNPEWSRKFGTQPEILDYLRHTAERFDVVRHMRFDTEVMEASFDEATRRWHIKTNQGDFTADILVSAVGAFAEASIPAIPGLETFKGTTFHSLHWKHEHSLKGERVAVIGTGASAVQFIPEIQPQVKNLMVFQRTPSWIVPRMDRAISALEKYAFSKLPVTQKITRGSWYAMIEAFGLPGFVDVRFRYPFEMLGRLQLKRQVRDPKLRKKLTPDYMIGCKRAIFSDAYYPALVKNNVQVITDGIAEVKEHSIVTKTGEEFPVDTIIFGTGFTRMPRVSGNIRGTDGRSITDRYRERPQSYLGTANAGFPNMFTVLGPFGAGGNQSAVFMIEGHAGYIVDAVSRIRREKITRFEVRQNVQDAFVDEVHERSQNGTWLKGGCSSYYTNGKGMNSGLYPNWSFEYRHRVRRWDIENYHIETAEKSK